MEYIEHDLKTFMSTSKLPFSPSEIKCLMIQLLQCIKFLHDNGIIHRHLKSKNLLLNNRGELKIHPGVSRETDIHCVAPELLLGATQLSTAIDMWSVGCVMAEMILNKPLFNGKTEESQIDMIFRMLGTPDEIIWPGFSILPRVNMVSFSKQYIQNYLLRKRFTSFTGLPLLSDAGFDLLNKFLTYDPNKRITVDDALNHEWFREVPLPKSKENMHVFPAQDDRRMGRKELKQHVTGSGDSSVEAQIY